MNIKERLKRIEKALIQRQGVKVIVVKDDEPIPAYTGKAYITRLTTKNSEEEKQRLERCRIKYQKH